MLIVGTESSLSESSNALRVLQCAMISVPSEFLLMVFRRDLALCFFRECLGTYDPNATYYTDTSVGHTWRSWFWIVYVNSGFHTLIT